MANRRIRVCFLKMKQNKIQTENSKEPFLTPLEHLLEFLRVPQKPTYRAIYIAIVSARLSPKPLTMGNLPSIARSIGIEPGLVRTKVRNMVKMDWLKITQIGGTTNPVLVLEPVWRVKKNVDKDKFAAALASFREDVKKDKEDQLSSNEIYRLMNSVCPHSKHTRDIDICVLHRYSECEGCKWECVQNDNRNT